MSSREVFVTILTHTYQVAAEAILVEEKEAALSAAIEYAKRTKEWHDNLTVYKWWRALRIIHEEKKSHTLWNAHKPTRT